MGHYPSPLATHMSESKKSRLAAHAQRWEEFANKDPYFYILTNNDFVYTTEEGQKRFFDTGEKTCECMLSAVKDLLPSCDQALEFGCGIGRLALPHAQRFREVIAVDISPTMLRRLSEIAERSQVRNIKPKLAGENWAPPGTVDYAYSLYVFQHISEYSVIEDAIKKVAICLRAEGVAQLQFDTRPSSLAYRIRNRVPDPLLPRTWRTAVRRIRRRPEQIRETLATRGLRIETEYKPSTREHTFIVRKI